MAWFAKTECLSIAAQSAARSGLVNPRRSIKQNGYTLIELLLALVVGAVIVAGSYTAYTVINVQYSDSLAKRNVQEMGIPLLNILERDIRAAGHLSRDVELETVYGSIFDPVVIVDSGDACCDRLELIYDKELTERLQTVYYVQQRTNPTRNALYQDVNQWDGANWFSVSTGSLVADYIDDFQVEIMDAASDGRAKLVDVNVVIRSRATSGEIKTYSKADYDIGNYNWTFTDAFYRQSFSTSVLLRNVR